MNTTDKQALLLRNVRDSILKRKKMHETDIEMLKKYVKHIDLSDKDEEVALNQAREIERLRIRISELDAVLKYCL